MGVGRHAWHALALALAALPAPLAAAPPGAGPPAEAGPFGAASKAASPVSRPPPARAATSSVDWAARRIVAHAHASPPGGARLWADVSAMGQALAEAQLRDALFAALQTLPLGCGAGAPGPVLANEARWRAWAQRATAHYVTLATTYGADGSVDIDAYLSLDEGPAQLGALWLALWQRHAGSAPEAPAGEGSLAAGLGSSGPGAEGPAAPGEAKHAPAPAARPPTGFVVTAQGLGARPTLWPRLVDGAGAALYGPATLRADVFAARGVAASHASLQDALHDPRVGERPLLVRAVALREPGGCELVVAEDDVAALRAHLGLLREGHVAIFVGPEG